LDVLSRRDDQDSEGRIEVPKERKRAKRHVGLAHPNFVSEIGNPVLEEDVVNCNRALELLVGPVSLADSCAKVQKPFSNLEVDHASSGVAIA
jgi:hypothetical protein